MPIEHTGRWRAWLEALAAARGPERVNEIGLTDLARPSVSIADMSPFSTPQGACDGLVDPDQGKYGGLELVCRVNTYVDVVQIRENFVPAVFTLGNLKVLPIAEAFATADLTPPFVSNPSHLDATVPADPYRVNNTYRISADTPAVADGWPIFPESLGEQGSVYMYSPPIFIPAQRVLRFTATMEEGIMMVGFMWRELPTV